MSDPTDETAAVPAPPGANLDSATSRASSDAPVADLAIAPNVASTAPTALNTHCGPWSF